jgi:hypothetical protein
MEEDRIRKDDNQQIVRNSKIYKTYNEVYCRNHREINREINIG